MKRLLCLLLAVAMLFALCACGEEKETKQDPERGNGIGDLCYGTQLTTITENGKGGTFDPTTLGKVTVINFWAYWCGPCVNEMPHFDRVAKEYADQVAVVAVHCDAVSRAKEFIRINYPSSFIHFATDNEKTPFGYYEVLGGSGSIPYTVVLDADGIIRKTFVGAINYATLKSVIEDCLKE